MSLLHQYQALDFEGMPIYVNPQRPDWFIPTPQTAVAIEMFKRGKPTENPQRFSALLDRFPSVSAPVYSGRATVRQLQQLKECWFHITNRCNMRCRHCLFSSGEEGAAELPFADLCSAIDQAYALGCRIFYFTGGEPFVYPRFKDVCERVLGLTGCHVVVLTNGRELPSVIPWLIRQDLSRLHLQISIDGLCENHEALRGQGSFGELAENLHQLRHLGVATTLSMSVNRNNVTEMTDVVEFAARHGVATLHFMWLFIKGKAETSLFAPTDLIFQQARRAYERAEQLQVTIDNFDIMKSQVFNFPGIRMDLGNACWESLTVGPDGNIYPSPATVFEPSLCCGSLSEGLAQVWTTSPIMHKIRALSVVSSPALADDALRFFHGGGDIDHSFIYSGEFVGYDPYLPLYRQLALYLISREAGKPDATLPTALLTRMGERIEECDESGLEVCFTHSNCVLSLADTDGRTSIRSFYSRAAEEVNEDIVNPVHYADELLEHIPESARVRSYGCGSPIMDCGLTTGEYLVDLGSGTGVECFIAARQTGADGQVYGIDMSDTMLARARAAGITVADNLGYANVEFKKGFLEAIPLPDDHCDVVISNCVINLSINKRQTFREIFRILKPGGRIVISDIIKNTEIPLPIQINEKLRGECIGGAMHERDLFGILADFDFRDIRVVKRFLYREVGGYPFYSLTYQAFKPGPMEPTQLIYRGPFAAIVTDQGQVIQRGRAQTVSFSRKMPLSQLSDDFMLLDAKGQVSNLTQEMCCCLPASCLADNSRPDIKGGHKSGCLVCGEPIIILHAPQVLSCQYCGKEQRVESCCEKGHFVCDQCHIHAAADMIKKVCLASKEKDTLSIFRQLHSHPDFPSHGPHHHPMVPGILLATYRNNGGAITDEQILTGISRGAMIPGASCSFFGMDGAALGVGIAFSVIMGATPFTGQSRQAVQKIVIRVAEKIASQPFSRCCQRECWTAFKEADILARELLAVPIPAQTPLICDQYMTVDHCAGKRCPLMP